MSISSKTSKFVVGVDNKKHDAAPNDNGDDDDDDYMSDKFLINDNSSQKTSLLHSHKQKYEHERYKRRMECQPKSKQIIKAMEEEKRQAGLSKPLLDPENKGFRLLQKMMTKTNDKIGSSSSCDQETNLKRKTVEQLIMERRPIDIELRIGRKGLGHESSVRNKRLKSESINKDNKRNFDQIDQDKFLRYRVEKSEKLLAKKDYFSLQKICYNLDHQSNESITGSPPPPPQEEWYWPKEFLAALRAKNDDEENEDEKNDDDEDEDDDENEIDYQERLEQLDHYVRSEYFYCLWCGCRYDSNVDLIDNCPGNTRQLH
ncbi:G patch domain-containing protein 11 [Dermatophagoides farinae]|uniref:G patch domain-containing protein 11 n=1 Tax=Dermatophagoides farinae TaxID=6954 RepID=A0A922HL45_DERFA|nr:G patch domain-containing protein 11 [Dermatophagoides farinae]